MVVAEQGSGCAQRIEILRPGGQNCVAFRRPRRRKSRCRADADADARVGSVDARGAQHRRFADRQRRLEPRVRHRTHRRAENVQPVG